MKRPFAVIGFSSLIVAVVLSNFNIFTANVTSFVALAVFLLSLLFVSPKSKYFALTLVSFSVLLVSISMLNSMKSYVNAQKFSGEKVSFTGTVTDASYIGLTEKLSVKVSSVNGEKQSFNIVVYNQSQTGISAGDIISAKAELSSSGNDEDSIEHFLSTKQYFTTFDMSSVQITSQSSYYKFVNSIKNMYKSKVSSYLPNELGSVAVGMTIGDRSGMSKYLRNCFSFSGTAHLLVVSGLHLTLFIALASDYISSLRRRKMLNLAVTTAFIVGYLALTGFSVSVVRAGVMIFAIKLARCFKKDADNLNSIGIAIFLLILFNPFAVFSVSLWLSLASTLGFILFSNPIHNFLYKSKVIQKATKLSLFKLVVDTFVISLCAMVLTLPIYIVYFKMFPILSFVTNLLTVDLSAVIMVFTLLGAFLDTISLVPIAKFLFYLSGICTKTLVLITEKISMLRYSTIAVSSRFFRAFLVLSLAIVLIYFIVNKFKRIKPYVLITILSILFVVTVTVSETFELSHPSVDVAMNGESVCVLVRDSYDSILVGIEDNSTRYALGDILGSHNLKRIGCIFVTQTGNRTPADIMRITETYEAGAIAFKENKISQLQVKYYSENTESLTLNSKVLVTPLSPKTTVVSEDRQDIYISCEKSQENLFKNSNKYDIIILCVDAFEHCGEEAKQYLKNPSSKIIVLEEGERITIYPDIREIYYPEKF